MSWFWLKQNLFSFSQNEQNRTLQTPSLKLSQSLWETARRYCPGDWHLLSYGLIYSWFPLQPHYRWLAFCIFPPFIFSKGDWSHFLGNKRNCCGF